jgi:hypothetical protein
LNDRKARGDHGLIADVCDLEERVDERGAAAQANAELRARERRARRDIPRREVTMHEIQDQLSAVNRERREIAVFIDANEAVIQESAGVEDGLVKILREPDEANAPMKKIKAKNDEFQQRTAELRERMTEQLGEIAKRIELSRSKT